MTATRKSLSAEVATRLGIPQYEARATLDAMLEAFTRSLAQGNRVHLKGWGEFSTRVRKGRGGVRNVRTGEPCAPLPRRRVVRFKPHWGVQ